MGLVKKAKTEELVDDVVETTTAETVAEDVVEQANQAIAQAQEEEQAADEPAENSEVVDSAEETAENSEVVDSAEETAEQAEVVDEQEEEPETTETESTSEEAETETAEEPETTKPAAKAEAKPTKEEPVMEKVVEKEVVETKSTGVAVKETTTEVAVSGNKAPAVAASQVIQQAEDDGFGGLELGFGSFTVIKLENSGNFADSDDNELGNHIRAAIQQSTASYLYVQEGNEDSPAVYSYDGINLTAETEDGDKTVEEVRQRWVEEGYDMECRKYLEVVATVAEDHDEIIDGEVSDDLLDLEGETVMFRLPPASLKAFSGKVATLKMQNKPIRGAVMDFKVGKQRKTNNGKAKYFPWKFTLVK